MPEPLVFIPDLMGDARAFGPQIADLSRDRAVTVAAPLQGERVEEIASAMLDILPKRAALVGQGLGADVALEILRRSPDRVTRLALCGGEPFGETPQQAATRDPRIIRARAGRLAEVMRAEIPPEHLAPGPQRAEVLALVMDMAEALGLEVYLRQSRALQRRRDQQAVLRRIAVPVLLLSGARDPVVTVRRQSFLAELIPGARLCVIEDAGRLPALEAPDAVSDALRDWLALPAR